MEGRRVKDYGERERGMGKGGKMGKLGE